MLTVRAEVNGIFWCVLVLLVIVDLALFYGLVDVLMFLKLSGNASPNVYSYNTTFSNKILPTIYMAVWRICKYHLTKCVQTLEKIRHVKG